MCGFMECVVCKVCVSFRIHFCSLIVSRRAQVFETDVCRQCALTAQEYANHQNQKISKQLPFCVLDTAGECWHLIQGHVSDVTSKSKLTKSIFEFFFASKQCETNRTKPQRALKSNGNQVNHFKCKLAFLQDEFRL